MKISKKDIPVIIAGTGIFYLMWVKSTVSLWDDIFLIVMLLAIAAIVVSLSGGIMG